MKVTVSLIKQKKAENKTLIQISKELGVSKSTLKRKCKELGLSFSRESQNLNKINKSNLKKCFKEGMTLEDVAEYYGVSRSYVGKKLQEFELSFKRTKFDLKVYNKLKKEGYTDKKIQEVMGLSESGLRYQKEKLNLEKQSRNFKYITQAQISELYLKERLPIKDLSKKLNKSITNIYKLLKKYDIPLRQEDGINISKREVKANLNKSVSEMAEQFRISEEGVKNLLIRYKLDKEKLYSDKGSCLNEFTELQKQLIFGSLLGDAHLSNIHTNVCMKIEHTLEQKEYVTYKYQILRNFVTHKGIVEATRYDSRTKKTYNSVTFKTKQSRLFTDIYSMFYTSKKKRYINEEVLNSLDERGLAFWFMDDGFKYNKYGLGLCTDNFNKDDLQKILDYFKNKWGIKGYLIPSGKNQRIVFNQRNAYLFQKLISPHILPSFTYKLIKVSHQKIIRETELKKDLKNLPFETESLTVKDFTFSYEDYSKEINDFIKKYEWLGKVGTQVKWVFTARYREHLGGVVLLNEPVSYSKILGKDTPKYEALIQRGCSASWTPKNLGSALIMFALKWMVKHTEKRAFMGYSDSGAYERGIIYQACNFDYLGNNFGSKAKYLSPFYKDDYFYKQSLYRTSSFKYWCISNDITIKDTWIKANGYKDLKRIPEKIKRDWYSWIKEVLDTSIQIKIPLKGKYVLVLGRDRRDQKYLNSLKEYKIYPYSS